MCWAAELHGFFVVVGFFCCFFLLFCRVGGVYFCCFSDRFSQSVIIRDFKAGVKIQMNKWVHLTGDVLIFYWRWEDLQNCWNCRLLYVGENQWNVLYEWDFHLFFSWIEYLVIITFKYYTVCSSICDLSASNRWNESKTDLKPFTFLFLSPYFLK